MTNERDMIDVQIEERTIYLEQVDREVAVFTERPGYTFAMPRVVWDRKGRPRAVKVSGEVVL